MRCHSNSPAKLINSLNSTGALAWNANHFTPDWRLAPVSVSTAFIKKKNKKNTMICLTQLGLVCFSNWRVRSEVSRQGLIHDDIIASSSFIFLPCSRGFKMPPEGSRNISMLQPRKRERMKGEKYVLAESFSFYQDISASIPLARTSAQGHP